MCIYVIVLVNLPLAVSARAMCMHAHVTPSLVSRALRIASTFCSSHLVTDRVRVRVRVRVRIRVRVRSRSEVAFG